MIGGDIIREVGRGGQSSKHQHTVHPYSTDLDGFLKKPIKYAGNTSLGKNYDYCSVTGEQLLTDLKKKD